MGLLQVVSYNRTMLTGLSPDLSSPLLQGLNPEQQASVCLPAQHALILAGAGPGKTRVLTTRIAWLLQTRQVLPGGLIAGWTMCPTSCGCLMLA